MEMVNRNSAGGTSASAGGIGRGLEQDLEHRERVAARLVGTGALLVCSALVAGIVWYVIAQFASSGQDALVKLDVPGTIKGLIPTIGSGGDARGVNAEFESILGIVTAWTNGPLFKMMAIATFLMGTGMGIVKQSIVPAVMGIVTALVFSTGPGVVLGVLGTGGHGDRSSGIAVTDVFDQDHDVAKLRKALEGVDAPAATKGYLLAQALVLAGKQVDTQPGGEFYQQVAATLETGSEATALNGASAGVRAYLERLAFGRTVSGPARDFESNRATARGVAGNTFAWVVGIGLDAVLGVLLVAMGLSLARSVKRIRVVMKAPDVDLSSHEVPDFTSDGSRHIEHMVSMLEKGRA